MHRQFMPVVSMERRIMNCVISSSACERERERERERGERDGKKKRMREDE